MKKLMAATAVVATVAFGAGTAPAFQCPTLIKQGRDAAAKMDAKDPKVKSALARLTKAEELHKDGKHADSVKKCEEAAEVAGITFAK